MLILKRSFSFSASHRLFNPKLSDERNLAIYGKCAGINGHGHNYKLEVALTGSIDEETGMLFNLQTLKELVEKSIIQDLDHKHLNFDVSWLEGKIPTTEILVEAIWQRLEEKLDPGLLHSMTIWETEKNVVTKTRT